MLNCYSVKMKINKYDKAQKKNIIAHTLLHAQEVENISEEFNINFGDTSKIFEAELQLTEKVIMNYSCRKCDSLENTISFEDISQVASLSSVPNMLKIRDLIGKLMQK